MNEFNLRHSETLPESFSLSATEENINRTKEMLTTYCAAKPISTIENAIQSIQITNNSTKPLLVTDNEVNSMPSAEKATNSMPTTIMIIEGRTYEVNGFFKPKGKTISEKIYGIMSKEVDNQAVLCYNDNIPQDSLAVGKIRRI